VATAVGAGGQPAFAAPKPAPSAASTADPAHGTRHQAGRSGSSATSKAAASTRAGATGNAKAAAGKHAAAATSKAATSKAATSKATSAPFEVGPPDAPTGVTATLNSDGTITANWAAPANVAAGIDHYTATASGGGGTCSTTDDTTTTCDIPAAGLSPSTAYT